MFPIADVTTKVVFALAQVNLIESPIEVPDRYPEVPTVVPVFPNLINCVAVD